ncbi:hypothetical protein CASFOL_019256 [Castilleja foliolosa]|uniref:Calmodulin-binding protein n=1 Tax=Castilleja foliolosa TaxID=1961234 RepID=A0ABD3D4N9_9LAMI
MVLKRHLSEGSEEGSQLPFKRRQFLSTLLKGVNYGRTLQESVSCLEPMIRKMVREEIAHAIDPYLRSSVNQAFIPRRLQLQFRGDLPHTLFTNGRVLSADDRGPVRIVLYDSISKEIITSGPLSSLKLSIVVLDGDFGSDDREDWTVDEFDKKTVKNRQGKRPLVTGDVMVTLQNGVGYIGEMIFTDNSSWIRSGKFRLGAKVHTTTSVGIKEAMSNAFKVKDHRGESYQKHHPPALDDEVWRLEKIAKDGPSHKKLTQIGILRVRDFLRLYFKDQFMLRSILHKSTNKTWETIVGHAQKCTLDENRYTYMTSQGTGLLFNSVYKVVGVTFDGHNYICPSSLNTYQMNILKQQAYDNLSDWVTVCDPSIIAGYPMILGSPGADTFNNSNSDLHGINFQEQEMNSDNCSFELGESSHSSQGLDETFKNGFGPSIYSPCELYIGGHNPTWPIDDVPVDDNFQVDSPAWQGSGLFVDPGDCEIGVVSSNSQILIPRNERTKARWCKVLAVVKWRILVRRNVAERKWRRAAYAYMKC